MPIRLARHRPCPTVLCAVVCVMLLGACDGGAGGAGAVAAGADAAAVNADIASTPTSLGCQPDVSLNVAPGRRLVNNAWGRSTAGDFPWRQCLLERRSGSAVAYGWEWDWPTKHSLYAYPEVVIGAKPWDPGPGNDTRFPRRIADTPSLQLHYDVQTTGTGERNLAASMWFIKTPQVAAVPVEMDIAAEMMVWSDYTPAMLRNDGPVSLRGEITVGGRVWQVWAAENWGGGAGLKVRWTFIVYSAKTQRGGTLDVDLRPFIDDAMARGLLKPDLYIANLELGNEIVSGSGRTIVRELSVTIP